MVCRCMGASKHMGCPDAPKHMGCEVNVLKEVILNSFYFGKVWGVMKETDFEQFLLWKGAVVLKELILNSFYFGTVWWS